MEKTELLQKPPIECDLKIGDLVSFKNDYGVTFDDMVVIGFSDGYMLDNYGDFIHTDFHTEAKHKGAAWWAPKNRSSLKKQNGLTGNW